MSSSTVHGSFRLGRRRGRHAQPRTSSPLVRFARGMSGVVKATVILTLAVSLGMVGTGGTYAYLNSSVSAAPKSTITAGTAALTVGTQSLNWSALAPGKSVTGTFTITNTGDVPLVLSSTITALMTPAATTNPFTIAVANGACPSSGVPTGSLNSTLAAGATTSACLAVTLPSNAPSGAQSVSAAITATISGVQP